MSEYLVSYDICAPRRLVRVHRLLRREATALQYSVFLFSGSERQLDRLLADAPVRLGLLDVLEG